MYPFLKDSSFRPYFFICAYDNSVLQNFKFYHTLIAKFFVDYPPRTEVTYHCINFNDRVRKVPKLYYFRSNILKSYFSDTIVEVNTVLGHFRARRVLYE